MKLEPGGVPVLMISGGAHSPFDVSTKLRDMGESHMDYIFWVFDATQYCVPCPDDPAQMKLARDVEEFHGFVQEYINNPDSQVGIIAIFSNRRRACELLDKTPISVCWPGTGKITHS